MPYVDDDPTVNYQPGGMPTGGSPMGNLNTNSGYNGNGYSGNSGQVNVQVNNFSHQNMSTPYTNSYTEQSMNYNSYRDDDNDSIMGEFLFSIALIAVAFIVPHIFFLVKKLLKRLHWLSPRVLRMLDKLETVFLKTTTKLSNRGIGKVLHLKGGFQGHEAAFIVKDTLGESLKEKLYVAPDDPHEVNYAPPPIEGEEYVNPNVEPDIPFNQPSNVKCSQKSKQYQEEYQEASYCELHFKTVVDEDDPSDPHAIIRRNLKEPI